VFGDNGILEDKFMENHRPEPHKASPALDSEERVEQDTYDAHIVPAETAARKEREGDAFKHPVHQTEDGSLDTSAGYTVDREGLMNNYAIEPEMYYEVPGDARESEEFSEVMRRNELEMVNTDNAGKLSEGEDQRGRGQGAV
jgi:hypothetical protein